MTQPVSPDKPAGEALSDGPITQAEMLLLFGATMPPEAVHLIYDPANDDKTLREIRRKLRQLAASRTPLPSAPDDEVGKGPVSVSTTPQTAIGAVLVWHSAEQLQRIEDKLDRLLSRLKDRGTD